jgi:hypothetical protein
VAVEVSRALDGGSQHRCRARTIAGKAIIRADKYFKLKQQDPGPDFLSSQALSVNDWNSWNYRNRWNHWNVWNEFRSR